ncbi:MAG: serine/threonine-protein kinase, partial [Fimbriiglobus sp.]
MADKTLPDSPVPTKPSPPMASGPTDHLTPGPFGRFQVVRQVGQGGMGVVYEAIDPALNRRVALKVLLPCAARDAVSRERFQREAKSAAAVVHDNVVTVYEIGAVGDVLYLSMEYLTGATLETYAGGRALPIAEVLRYAREIAAGLAAAHAVGLIHRDLKPGNVWLDARTGRVRLLDFGLALLRIDAARLTADGVAVGTPSYMSPEQASARPLDHRADLFSLGGVMYRLATGQVPFAGKTQYVVVTAVLTADPEPLRTLRPDVPPAVAGLIQRLLAKDPAGRPPTAAAVRDEIARMEAELAIQAAPSPAARPIPRRTALTAAAG